jgi:putative phosphoesterase
VSAPTPAPELVVLADTHADGDLPLTDHLRAAVAEAELVVHAGDFTTTTVLEDFETFADRFVAVAGNADSAGVRSRLPGVRTVEALGRRFLLVHGHEHDDTSLPLLARQEDADVAVVGHTHRPGVEQFGDLTVLNPGSHADPRGGRPAYAWLERIEGTIRGGLRTPTGERIQTIGL